MGITTRMTSISLFLVVSLTWSMVGCKQISDLQKKVRQPVAAGEFYPNNNKELNNILKKAFRTAPPPKLNGELKALLLPDAAYKYTGILSAMAMKTLVGKQIDTIYILGHSRRPDIAGALTWQGQAWRTPLGLMAIDSQAVSDLLNECPDIHLYARAWEQDYSIEMHLPFLQTVVPKAKIVPIIMGTATWEECWSVAAAIAKQAKNKRALVLISSTMAQSSNQKTIEAIDKQIIEVLKKMNVYQLDDLNSQLLSQGIPNLTATLNGLSIVKTGLLAAYMLDANQGQLIHYTNRGQLTGETKRVIGYGAMAFIKNKSQKELAIEFKRLTHESLNLTMQEKNELLNIARASIREGFGSGRALRSTTAKKNLLKKYPVFVKLIKNGELRGAYGLIDEGLPIHQAVANMACQAAFKDGRFAPLSSDELPFTDIEINILTTINPVSSINDIILGDHGVIVKRGNRQGLALPEEAIARKWTKEQVLNDLCLRKAGLPIDAWRDKRTKLYTFKVKAFTQEAKDASP